MEMDMEIELDPVKMAQLRSIVESICEDEFPEIKKEFFKNASDYTIKKIWHIIMGWEDKHLKLIDLKRIVER